MPCLCWQPVRAHKVQLCHMISIIPVPGTHRSNVYSLVPLTKNKTLAHWIIFFITQVPHEICFCQSNHRETDCGFMFPPPLINLNVIYNFTTEQLTTHHFKFLILFFKIISSFSNNKTKGFFVLNSNTNISFLLKFNMFSFVNI